MKHMLTVVLLPVLVLAARAGEEPVRASRSVTADLAHAINAGPADACVDVIIHSNVPGALSIGDPVEFIQFKDLGALRIARILNVLEGFRASYHVWSETMIEAAMTRRQAEFLTTYPGVDWMELAEEAFDRPVKQCLATPGGLVLPPRG